MVVNTATKNNIESSFNKKCNLLIVAWEDPHNNELFALNQDHEDTMETKITQVEKTLERIMKNIGMDEQEMYPKKDDTLKAKIELIWDSLRQKNKNVKGKHSCSAIPERRGLYQDTNDRSHLDAQDMDVSMSRY